MGELSVVQKSLAGACGETREGLESDSIGGAVVNSASGLADGADVGLRARGIGVAAQADAGDAQLGADAGAGGIVPAFVVSPESTDEAAAVMRVAAEHGLAVVVRGAGSRLGWGVPPTRCDLMIDMSRLGAVVEHSAGDLVDRKSVV